MEGLIPRSMREDAVLEGNIYFFEKGTPIGVQDHMHVCIKRKNKVVIFTTCSSKLDTAKRLILHNGWNSLTLPFFKPDEATNKFDEETYINCNSPYIISVPEFVDLIDQGLVRRVAGELTDKDLKLIKYGIQASPLVVRKIKKMFE